MAMTIEELKTQATALGLKYFVHPDQPKIILGVTGSQSRFQLTVALDVGGQFLQVRSAEMLHCPATHPHAAAVLQLLASLNYQFRMVKWGWDRNDGEVVAYCDAWLADGKPTQPQFGGLLEFFMQSVDSNMPRIQRTIETGTDPGPIQPKPTEPPAGSKPKIVDI